MPTRLSVLRSVAEVWQRQRSARQGRCSASAAASARCTGRKARLADCGGDPPLDGRPHRSVAGVLKHTANTQMVAAERSDNAIRSQSQKLGAHGNYLVGGVLAT